MRPTILLDCDGVLCDFVGGVLDVLASHGIRRTNESINAPLLENCLTLTELDIVNSDCKGEPGWCYSLKPTFQATDFVEDLQKWAEVVVVTAPWDTPTWMDERATWLKTFFGADIAGRAIFTKNKRLIQGGALVEDSPLNLLAWKERHSGFPILIDQPWNRGVTSAGWRHFSLESARRTLEKAFLRD